ncbi:MAG: DUF2238 domain-containing protein [Phycisphaeraceae bacterium]
MIWPHHRYARWLLLIYLVAFIPLSFNVFDRLTWLLENVMGLGVVALLFLTRNRFPLSRLSYTLIFIHLMLHTIAAHYTYSMVPYNECFTAILGSGPDEWFGWERNNYDRLVHFLYGLLIAYPIRELFVRVADVKGFWGYFLPLDVTMSTSMLYELIEWFNAELIGDGSHIYLGSQGDEWDAHWDMALATLGAIIAMSITTCVNWRLKKDFAKELAESVRVKRRHPLGEDEITAMRQRSDEVKK